MVSCDTESMAYVDDIHLPQFPSDLTCEAAGLDAGTLKNWISRKPPAVFLANNERVEAGDRTFFRFSYRRVMQIAITVELVRNYKIPPREAAMIAAEFSDAENSASSRKAGELFKENFTLLVVLAGHASIVNARDDEIWRAIPRLSLMRLAINNSHLVVNVNAIDWQVRSVLGIPWTARKGVL